MFPKFSIPAEFPFAPLTCGIGKVQMRCHWIKAGSMAAPQFRHKSQKKGTLMIRHSRKRITSNNSVSPLEIQQLEPRTLLTGTVTLALSAAGDISVTGDSKDNNVTVEVDSGGIHVTGLSGTSLRYGKMIHAAGDTVTLPIPSVIRDLRVDMKGGNDTLSFTSTGEVNVGRDVDIDMGAGNDRLTIADSAGINVGRNFKALTSAGNDKVVISTNGGQINVGNDLSINTGPGNDAVGLADAEKFAGVTDAATLLAVADDTGTEMSQQIRVGRDLNITTGGGNDTVGVAGVEAGRNANLNTGAGRGDILGVSNLRAGRNLDLNLGDTNALQNVTVARTIKVRSGASNDRFVVDRIHAGSVDVNLQGGNDQLAIGADVVVTGRVNINGGAGKNSLESMTSLSGATVRNFKGTSVDSMAILDTVLAAIAAEGLIG